MSQPAYDKGSCSGRRISPYLGRGKFLPAAPIFLDPVALPRILILQTQRYSSACGLRASIAMSSYSQSNGEGTTRRGCYIVEV